MSNWRPVDVRLWNDRKFLACSDGARLLWLFLLTCPSLPIPGVVVGGDAALAELLGWTPERLRERFAELSRNGLQVRREARIVWLQNALKYQPPANPNMVKSWGKKWDDVPEGELKVELWEALRIACKSWSVLFSKLFQKPFNEGSWNGSANGSWNGSAHEHQHDHQHQHDHDLEEEDLSLAHTIPGDGGQPGSGEPGPRATQQGAATPGQEATAQGAVPAAGNVAEPQFDPTGHRVERPPSPGPYAPAIAGPYNPDDPRAIGRLAESTWRRISDAAIALAAELKLPEPIPFPAITPSTQRAGFVELKSRIREEGELAPTVCDRVVENLVKQARSKRSVDWLAEKVFGDKAWVNARNGIDPSARPPVPRRGDPLPPAPAPPRPERPPPDPVLSAEDRAEILALAARVGANPDAVAAAELASGRVPAHMPTAELVKRFGDGQRAPPDDASTEEPRKPPARRKATT